MDINNLPVVGVHLDKRRILDDGSYPVKLRVYHNYSTRFYGIGFGLTEDEFRKAFKENSPKLISLRKRTQPSVDKANAAVEKMRVFTFEEFESLYLGKGLSTYLEDVFNSITTELKANQQIGTIKTYTQTLASLNNYWAFRKDVPYDILRAKGKHLKFEDITESFLDAYKLWLLSKELSTTTIGIYLRPLRAAFNWAMSDKRRIIPKDIYPFGKDKFTIGKGSKKKRDIALSKEEINKLWNYDPKEKYQQRAKDFFFFSYLANGMNVNDILNLKRADIRVNTISFVRNKSKRTTTDVVEIHVYILPAMWEIMKRQGNGKGKNIFSILEGITDEEKKKKKIDDFIKNINKNLKELCAGAEVDKKITTYSARHSFATILRNSGAPLSFISERLGHTDEKTTMHYLNKFPQELASGYMSNLMPA